ncbi:MAG: TetR/AcrR family transcriptional regulator [Trueperaceae bacterium]
MPRPKKEHAQNTRALALNAAHVMLHTHGYLGVSMEVVAETIGVSKAALYYHFPQGKEQLILEIAETEITNDAKGIGEAIKAGKTVRKKLEGIANFVFSHYRPTGRILEDSLRFMPEEQRKRIYGMFYEQQYKRVLDVMNEGVKQKEFRRHDTEKSAWAFMGLLSEMNSPDPKLDRKELATFVVDLMIRGVQAS